MGIEEGTVGLSSPSCVGNETKALSGLGCATDCCGGGGRTDSTTSSLAGTHSDVTGTSPGPVVVALTSFRSPPTVGTSLSPRRGLTTSPPLLPWVAAVHDPPGRLWVGPGSGRPELCLTIHRSLLSQSATETKSRDPHMTPFDLILHFC